MSLAHRPDDVSPSVAALLADLDMTPGSLDVAIDERDEMLAFLVEGMEGDRDRALFTYFHSGLSIADGMLQVLRWRFGDRPLKVLDFASGYGRVTRFLVRELPPESLWVSDVYEDGLRFQRERLGVSTVLSTVRPEDFVLDETFDAVLVTSLFTHLPEARFVDWLRVLCERLRPGGVLAFSTHHPSLLEPCPDLPESGLLFRDNSESTSLDPGDYGSTWVTESFVRNALARVAPGCSVLRLARGICNYQDFYVAVLGEGEPEVDFSSLEYTGQPHLFLEHCSHAGIDNLRIQGWAAVRTGTLEAVEVLLDGQVLASFPVDRDRPEVAALLGEDRYLRSGWGGMCPLPAGLSRFSAVLLIRMRDSRGVLHPMRAGSIDSLILEATRNDLRAVQKKLVETGWELEDLRGYTRATVDGLRDKISAMETSGFWKGRMAWFRLKRALRLTDEE
ncbi:MAG: class I SAM-dependent methyltransferase [Acidobacteriota bacterium]